MDSNVNGWPAGFVPNKPNEKRREGKSAVNGGKRTLLQWWQTYNAVHGGKRTLLQWWQTYNAVHGGKRTLLSMVANVRCYNGGKRTLLQWAAGEKSRWPTCRPGLQMPLVTQAPVCKVKYVCYTFCMFVAPPPHTHQPTHTPW